LFCSLFCLLPSLLCLLLRSAFHSNPTLTEETGNNTSAATTFTRQDNGNVASGNVSKVLLQSLLYPGSTARLYAHLMPWFG
jgi:hypothetical protein